MMIRTDPGRLASRWVSVSAGLRWPVDSPRFRLLAAALLGLFAVYGAVYFAITAARAAAGQPIGDFFGLWSCARFLFDHPATAVYDPAALHAAQVALGMDPQGSYPFPYPPSFLVALWPLGLLPYWAAYCVAVVTTLVLFVWATVWRDWRSPMTLAALLAPTTTITVIAGQMGFLTAALLAGGCRLLATRPILAGMLLGLLTYKPQMGILVPVALVAAGLWRTIIAAMVTVLCLVIVAGIVFGLAIWPAWVTHIFAYADQFAAESGGLLHLMPTVTGALLQHGINAHAAQLCQMVAALAAAAAVWRCWRTGASPLAGAALIVATFLATPHAFVYDMPVLATAVLWVIAERRRRGAAFGCGEILVLLLAMIAPITLPPGAAAVPLVPLSLVLLLLTITRSCEASRRAEPGVIVTGG